MIRRSVVLAVAALLPLASLAPAAADSPPENPPGTVQITPASGGSTIDTVMPLAGSANDVVYQQQPSSSSPAQYSPRYDRLVARSDTGSTTDLGTVPDTNPEAPYSLVGNTLTNHYGDTAHRVLWWRLSDASSGSITLPATDFYETAGPGGFVYRRAERLFREKLSGAAFDLGRPFVGAHPTAIADGQGFLATVGDRAKYGVFGHPNHFRTLDTGGHTLSCRSIAGNFAACVDQVGTPVLLPLDGRPAHVMSGVRKIVFVPDLALSGSTLLAVDGHGYEHSLAYSSSTVHTSSTRYDIYQVSAFGRAIILYGLKHHLYSLTSATAKPATVVDAPHGPPTASSVSLSPGQAAYSDNREAPGVPPASASSFRTPVSTSAPDLTVGTESVIEYADAGPTMASGTTTVYASTEDDNTGDDNTETLVVRSPNGSRTIPNVNVWSPSLSGNRLVYSIRLSSTTRATRLYDVATDTISDPQGDGPPIASGAIVYGDHLAYSTSSGAVEYQDIDTGHTVEVAAAPENPCGTALVYIAADHVGWSQGCVGVEGYRDTATMAPAVDPDGYLVGLSDSGAVVQTPTTASNTYNIVLEPYTGGGDVVLQTSSGGEYVAPPPVSGRTQAWIDQYGALKVAPLAITPPAPRFETDPVVLPASGGTVLHDYAPYSQPLTSCSVTITNSAQQTVATLPCDSSQTPFGVAEFSWDGQSGGSAAPAGTYTYSITAAGDGGAAQDADGTTNPVTGTFTIG